MWEDFRLFDMFFLEWCFFVDFLSSFMLCFDICVSLSSRIKHSYDATGGGPCDANGLVQPFYHFIIVIKTTVGRFLPPLHYGISCPLSCFLCETLIDDKGTKSSGTLVIWQYVPFARAQLNYVLFWQNAAEIGIELNFCMNPTNKRDPREW